MVPSRSARGAGPADRLGVHGGHRGRPGDGLPQRREAGRQRGLVAGVALRPGGEAPGGAQPDRRPGPQRRRALRAEPRTGDRLRGRRGRDAGDGRLLAHQRRGRARLALGGLRRRRLGRAGRHGRVVEEPALEPPRGRPPRARADRERQPAAHRIGPGPRLARPRGPLARLLLREALPRGPGRRKGQLHRPPPDAGLHRDRPRALRRSPGRAHGRRRAGRVRRQRGRLRLQARLVRRPRARVPGAQGARPPRLDAAPDRRGRRGPLGRGPLGLA